MNDLPGYDASQDRSSRRPLSDEERRLLLEKRIKELRKRKRREQRGSRSSIKRVLAVTLILVIFLLCVFSSIFTLFESGGNENYLATEIIASNLEEIRDAAIPSGQLVEPVITASAAYLAEPASSDILYQKNPDQRLSIASTTKIMTAIVAMENTSLQDSVTISEKAISVGESSAWLGKGETLTMEQLLYALLVQSANDAAVAIAEHVGGSEESFVGMMNEKASELGLENTHFANSHGLDQEGHYSSARDLATIAAYAMQISLFREIAKSSGYQIPWPGHPYPRVMENHNKLLNMYPYATGIKTGYTLDAGKCLVASAEKEGRELISVILNGGESYWDQTIQLMEYGFNSFAVVEYAYSGQSLASVSVGNFPRRRINAVPLTDLSFTVRRDYLQDFERAVIYYREWLPYTVANGQEVGYIVAAEGSVHEQRGDLISDSRCPPPNIFVRFLAFVVAVLSLWWKGILWLIPGL